MKRVIIAALFALALSTPATVKAEDPVDPNLAEPSTTESSDLVDEALRELKERDQAKYAYFTDVLINTQWEHPTSGGIQTYSFLENGDYVATWKPDKSEPRITEGAWKFGDGICWNSLNKNNQGNLMIYLPRDHCCYRAAFVGTKLTLSAVAGDYIYCDDKTLRPYQQ